MCYYTKQDAHICAQLKRINQLVYEGFISSAEATARARLIDPAIYTCPKCGCIQAACQCTVEIDPSVIEEIIRNERH